MKGLAFLMMSVLTLLAPCVEVEAVQEIQSITDLYSHREWTEASPNKKGFWTLKADHVYYLRSENALVLTPGRKTIKSGPHDVDNWALFAIDVIKVKDEWLIQEILKDPKKAKKINLFTDGKEGWLTWFPWFFPVTYERYLIYDGQLDG